MPSLRGVRIERPARDTLTPLAIYLVATIVSAIFLAIGASRQAALPVMGPAHDVSFPLPASPGFFGVMSNWDGQWFRSIVERGYPTSLPTQGGEVIRNEWAFWPLYPLLVRAAMAITGLEFGPSAWVVSVICAALSMVLLYRLVLPTMGRFGAGALIACLCAFPTSAILQVGYAESLTLLFITLALTALQRQRYVFLLLAALGLSLTRPVVLPLAAVIGLHGWRRYRRSLHHGEPFPIRERWLVAAVAVATAALLGLWPLVADIVTGQRNAYLTTLGAWAANQDSAGALGGWLHEIASLTPMGILAAAAMLVLFGLVLRPGGAAWGADLRTWALIYPLYLLAATPVTLSIVRYFLLAIAPFWPLPDPPRPYEAASTTWARWALLSLLVLLGFVLQYLWVLHVFTIAAGMGRQPFP